MRVRAVISLLCTTLVAGLCAMLAGGGALAETIIVNDQVTVRQSNIARPTRGMRMTQVEHKFGEPATRHPAVGRPPITRWDYPEFSVFFERDIVLHSVVTGGHPSGGEDHAAGEDHSAATDDHSAATDDHSSATDDHSAAEDHSPAADHPAAAGEQQ
jgi:hypothetical protein